MSSKDANGLVYTDLLSEKTVLSPNYEANKNPEKRK